VPHAKSKSSRLADSVFHLFSNFLPVSFVVISPVANMKNDCGECGIIYFLLFVIVSVTLFSFNVSANYVVFYGHPQVYYTVYFVVEVLKCFLILTYICANFS